MRAEDSRIIGPILAVLIGGFIIAAGLSGCNQVIPPTADQIVQDYLTKQGLHVVDINQIGVQNSDGYVPSHTLCLSAPYSVAYRAYQQDGRTQLGVACVEKDNTVVIQLTRIIG